MKAHVMQAVPVKHRTQMVLGQEASSSEASSSSACVSSLCRRRVVREGGNNLISVVHHHCACDEHGGCTQHDDICVALLGVSQPLPQATKPRRQRAERGPPLVHHRGALLSGLRGANCLCFYKVVQQFVVSPA
eukprot:TRINITY_DN7198_c0_g2_i3.p1 TRINITY_DN7198_c0_g2~~TRINITY_DN7198_c0_g2_i3.p1  ORF type:complete len:133 (+),score=5.46 TRINITY_DN7198_c0_g2_i3:355-753(+)